MARRSATLPSFAPVKSFQVIKAEPDIEFRDGFRGDQRLAWRPDPNNPDGQLLAVLCRCERWWGWLRSSRVASGIADVMEQEGCAKCIGG